MEWDERIAGSGLGSEGAAASSAFGWRYTAAAATTPFSRAYSASAASCERTAASCERTAAAAWRKSDSGAVVRLCSDPASADVRAAVLCR